MSPHKPTLITLTVRRHLLAAALTLAVLLLGTLALIDGVMLRVRSHALQAQLAAIDPAADTQLLLCDIGSGTEHPHAGVRLLDRQGHYAIKLDSGITRVPAAQQPTWSLASSVLRLGVTHGAGRLPWVSEPVVWAARALPGPSPEILVVWERVGAIRAVFIPIYLAVLVATLLAFAVSVTLALSTVRSVRGVLTGIAESSGQLAAGDFRVQLAPQPTAELDQVTSAINALARDLEHTSAHLRAEQERLTCLEGMQRRFVADASHELRAPLTSMRVTLEAWQDGVLRPEEQPAALTQMIGEIERVAALVKRLLDLSRIEAGRETYQFAPVDLTVLATDIAARYATPGVAPVSLELPAELPPVRADHDALTSVLRNLLENAQRFTPADGQVRLWAKREDGEVRLGVSDTGCGIIPELLPYIWDRFWRAPETRAQGQAGSGLGLALVKAQIEAMSGQVGAESTPGAGTTVWVRLPVWRDEGDDTVTG